MYIHVVPIVLLVMMSCSSVVVVRSQQAVLLLVPVAVSRTSRALTAAIQSSRSPTGRRPRRGQPCLATATRSPPAKGGADVSNGGSNERTASSNGRTTLKSGSPAPNEGTAARSVWKERAAVSASLNGTALKKSATSKGRNINSTVARSATTNSTVHRPYRTSNNQNETCPFAHLHADAFRIICKQDRRRCCGWHKLKWKKGNKRR